jgi:hypothetical protein
VFTMVHRAPSDTARKTKRSHHARPKVTKTLARAGHAPSTEDHHDRSKQ